MEPGWSTLRERVSELDGGVAKADRLREEQEAKAKEERIELLRRQVGRRMMNAGITRGWQAWVDFWEAKLYAMSRLREVGNRLKSPELADAFELWETLCAAEAQRKLAEAEARAAEAEKKAAEARQHERPQPVHADRRSADLG